jgi:hypothetical protein
MLRELNTHSAELASDVICVSCNLHVVYCDMLLTTGACNNPAIADVLHNDLRYSGHHPDAYVFSQPKKRLRET